jgi:3-hydroxy-9,10-secoandrosta-1,3,5(10)-triene-9,17-dione monooxygenase reductase component
VNVLASHHDEVSGRFAARGRDRFAGLRWVRRPCGAGIADAVSWIDCEIEARHDGGDHLIVVGRVRHLHVIDEKRRPLVFHRGGYGSVTALQGI